jgi:tetratricopeptide (TPR) repeat protein
MKNQGKRIAFVSLLSVLFLGLSFTAFSQTPAPSDEGLKLIEREQPKKGVEALRKDPNNYFNLGTGLLITGNASEALSTFEKGIAADPKNALCYVGKGRVLLKQNKLQEAEAEFKKATDMTKSKNADVLAAIGEAWMDKPELASKAKPILEASVGRDKNFKAFMLLGDFYAKQGNGGNAISNYEHAASVAPKDGAPHYKIGLIYTRSGNIEAAKEAFTKAITVDPTYTGAYRQLAKEYYNAKDCENAVKNQQKYMELTENPDSGLMAMGFYQFMCKNYTKANDLFKQTDSKGLLKATGIRFYANSLALSQDFPSAQSMFERYFALDTADEEAASDWKTYGDVLEKIAEGKAKPEKRPYDSLASIAYGKSLEIEPNQSKVLEAMADILLNDLRHTKDAIAAYQKLIALRGKAFAGDVFKLGQAFYYDQQFDSAARRFLQLGTMQPTLTVGYLWAGRAHAQMDPESTEGLAKPDFEKVIEIGSANQQKFKADLVQAYSYLGYYYYLQKDLDTSLKNWKDVLKLDSNNEQAKTAVTSIEKMKKQGQTKSSGTGKR